VIKRIFRFADSFEGVLRHIGVIFSANAIVAILGLFSLVLLTQSVGAVGLGLLALVEAYPRTIDQVFRFEPSQALIRYGTRSIERGDSENLRKLIKWATVMDFVGAAGAALVALATLHLANIWLQLSPNELFMAQLFTLTVFTYISATPVAVFRVLSKFGTYAKILVISAVIKFLSLAVLWWLEASILAFFYAIALNAVFQHLLPFVLAWRLISKDIEGPIMSLSFEGVLKKNKGILRFIFNANANVLTRNASRQFDVVLLGGLVGHTEIGLYQMAKRVALAAIRFSRPIETVVYPRLSQLWEQGHSQRVVMLVLRFITLFMAVSAPFLLFFWFLGDFFIEWVFGPEFMQAKPLLLIQLVASALLMTTAVLNSALLSIDQDKQLLMVTLVSSILFLGGIVVFVPVFGIIAASWLTLAMNVSWALGCGFFFYRATK
jgi:O-antigen/teichoic acid export membrane protein